MKHLIRTSLLLLLLANLSACVDRPSQQPTVLRSGRTVIDQPATVPNLNRYEVSNQQRALIKEINITRQQHGLSALQDDGNLMNAAQEYAQTLSNIGDISHIGPNGDKPGERARVSGYEWGFIAENLASGQDTPVITVQDWLKSPSHRDALLHVDPVHIGVGHVSNPNDPNYKEYWVMLVGKPL